jgi:hypothetical protein
MKKGIEFSAATIRHFPGELNRFYIKNFLWN